MKINTPISVGELVDKLTILEIKSAMIKDEGKLKDVSNERNELNKKIADLTNPTLGFNFSVSQLFALKADLHEINLGLWKIEDQIRECERNKDFGAKFIRLARDVYYTNDERFEIKNRINQLTSSNIKEVKSYESYS
jgi:hypothetical protein